MKVAIITCYFDPDYVRSLTLRAALALNPDVELIVIKNRYNGLLRYPETLLRIIWTRLHKRPDVYLLTFRGQEILPFLLALAWPKPILFDEFVLPLAWANQEKLDKTLLIRFQQLIPKFVAPLYKRWLKQCRFIIEDTEADADESARLSGIKRDKYRVLPVGAEEELFRPPESPQSKTGTFEVFFCGNMRPLYGLEYVLEAAMALKDKPDIHFYIVGGKDKAAEQVAAAQAVGAHISYDRWVKFDQLSTVIQNADLCLAGPFGLSPQAERVVTGKTYQFLACAAPTIIGANNATSAFTDGLNSLLVSRGDAGMLRAKIQWAYDHRSELPTLGAQGRALYDEAFSTKVISRQLKAILSEL